MLLFYICFDFLRKVKKAPNLINLFCCSILMGLWLRVEIEMNAHGIRLFVLIQHILSSIPQSPLYLKKS